MKRKDSKDGKPIVATQETNFIKKIQAQTTSGDELNQACARANRDLLPAFVKWLNDERERGTPDAVVISVLPFFVGSQVGTALLNFMRDGKAAAGLMDDLKPEFDRQWRRAREQVRAQPKGIGLT